MCRIKGNKTENELHEKFKTYLNNLNVLITASKANYCRAYSNENKKKVNEIRGRFKETINLNK